MKKTSAPKIHQREIRKLLNGLHRLDAMRSLCETIRQVSSVESEFICGAELLGETLFALMLKDLKKPTPCPLCGGEFKRRR